MKSRLNYRQQELRKRFIREGGNISVQTLADEFHVTRATIWADFKRIRQEAPIRGMRTGTGDWNEAREVEAQLERFDDLLDQAAEEINRLEAEIDARHGETTVPALMSAKVSAHNHLLSITKARSEFLIAIGWFTPAQLRLHLTREEIPSLRGEALDERIRELDGILGPDPLGYVDDLIDETTPVPAAGECGGEGLAGLRQRARAVGKAGRNAARGGPPGADRDVMGRFRPGSSGSPRRKGGNGNGNGGGNGSKP